MVMQQKPNAALNIAGGSLSSPSAAGRPRQGGRTGVNPRLSAALLLAVILAEPAHAQEPYRLVESLPPGTRYAVELKANIQGKMAVPATREKPAQILAVSGQSLLKYDERTLAADDKDAEKVLRAYRTVDFQRTVGTVAQTAGVRVAVRRMVVHRRTDGVKVAFSPDGPLLWGELDVVRTDLFAPALVAGLLPETPVRVGDAWKLTAAAVAELTDMEKIEAGELTAKFAAIVKVHGKDHARLELTGTVRGVDSFGPGQHRLDGTAYFALEAKFLAHVSLTGVHDLLDGANKIVGRIDGRFTLSRTPGGTSEDLNDDAVKALELKPSPANTQLLYDNADLGVRFEYPRRWRVGAVQGRQLTLDGPNGAGILVTLEPAGKVPTAAAYLAENRDFLAKQNATLGPIAEPKRQPDGSDRFGFDAELNRDALRMEYAVRSQPEGGILAAARFPRADAAVLTADFERILAKLTLTKRP